MPQPPSELLNSKLREENAALKTRLSEARDTIAGCRSQLDAQNRATFRHSRLVRLLESLKIPIPSTDDEYISKDFFATAESALAAREDVTKAHRERDVALMAMRLLLGGKVTVNDAQEGQDVVTFALENEDLNREMSFSISWDDEKIEYNSISIRVEEAAAPQFADEKCIVFDFGQGPMFLAEVLSAVHGVQLDSGKEAS